MSYTHCWVGLQSQVLPFLLFVWATDFTKLPLSFLLNVIRSKRLKNLSLLILMYFSCSSHDSDFSIFCATLEYCYSIRYWGSNRLWVFFSCSRLSVSDIRFFLEANLSRSFWLKITVDLCIKSLICSLWLLIVAALGESGKINLPP